MKLTDDELEKVAGGGDVPEEWNGMNPRDALYAVHKEIVDTKKDSGMEGMRNRDPAPQ